MEWLRLSLLYLHLIGFALLLGGAAVQYLSGRIRMNAAMLWGSGAQLVTGLALAATVGAGGDEQDKAHDPAFLAIKGIVAVLIFVMVFFSRRREQVNRGHFLAVVGLTLVNAAVATFWR